MATTFDEILGHAGPVQMLQRLITQQTIAGTYLFSGPEHLGKTSVAVALAKALLCEHARGAGCRECKSCSEVQALSHPDVCVVSPEGKSQTIGVEQIEELRRRAHLSSFHGGWRIGIIEQAHTLHYQSAPALLKILEEPPARSVFLLITHKEEQMLPTIRSRCKTILFSGLSHAMVEKVLATEGPADSAERRTIVELAGGRPGMALRIARDEFLSRRDKILALLENLSVQSFSGVVSTVEGLLELTARPSGKTAGSQEAPDRDRAAQRDLLYCLQTLLRDAGIARYEERVPFLHPDRKGRLTALARKWPGVSWDAVLRGLEKGARDLESNVSLRLILETVFLRLA